MKTTSMSFVTKVKHYMYLFESNDLKLHSNAMLLNCFHYVYKGLITYELKGWLNVFSQ